MKTFTVWIGGRPHEAFSFGQEIMDAAGGIAEVKDLVSQASTALDDAISRMGVFTLNKDDKRRLVDDWQYTAKGFLDLSDQVLGEHPERTDEWKRLGLKMVSNANELATYIGDDTLSRFMHDFIVNFPAALDATYKAVLAKASEVATEVVQAAEKPVAAAAWGSAKVLLILGGAAALSFFLLRKSGVRGGIGPVRLGGIPAGRRLIRGYGGLKRR